MAHGCSNTIITSVTTANHDDIFSLGTDVGIVLQLRVQEGFGVELKEINKGMSETETSIPEGTPWQSEFHQRFG